MQHQCPHCHQKTANMEITNDGNILLSCQSMTCTMTTVTLSRAAHQRLIDDPSQQQKYHEYQEMVASQKQRGLLR